MGARHRALDQGPPEPARRVVRGSGCHRPRGRRGRQHALRGNARATRAGARLRADRQEPGDRAVGVLRPAFGVRPAAGRRPRRPADPEPRPGRLARPRSGRWHGVRPAARWPCRTRRPEHRSRGPALRGDGPCGRSAAHGRPSAVLPVALRDDPGPVAAAAPGRPRQPPEPGARWGSRAVRRTASGPRRLARGERGAAARLRPAAALRIGMGVRLPGRHHDRVALRGATGQPAGSRQRRGRAVLRGHEGGGRGRVRRRLRLARTGGPQAGQRFRLPRHARQRRRAVRRAARRPADPARSLP